MSGPRLDGNVWRCKHGWLARVLGSGEAAGHVTVFAPHLEFRRSTVVLYEIWDPEQMDIIASMDHYGIHDRRIFNGTEVALVDRDDAITWIMCRKCGTDSLTVVAAPPDYWATWGGGDPYASM